MVRAGMVAMAAIPVRHPITILPAFRSRLYCRRALPAVLAVVHTVVVIPIVILRRIAMAHRCAMILHRILLSVCVLAIVVIRRTAGKR